MLLSLLRPRPASLPFLLYCWIKDYEGIIVKSRAGTDTIVHELKKTRGTTRASMLHWPSTSHPNTGWVIKEDRLLFCFFKRDLYTSHWCITFSWNFSADSCSCYFNGCLPRSLSFDWRLSVRTRTEAGCTCRHEAPHRHKWTQKPVLCKWFDAKPAPSKSSSLLSRECIFVKRILQHKSNMLVIKLYITITVSLWKTLLSSLKTLPYLELYL